MKYQGKTVEALREKVVVIPHGDLKIPFKCSAVVDHSTFEALCPRPTPPTIQKPGKDPVLNPEDPAYGKQLTEWANKRTSWLFITSLRATKDLEWDTVKYDDPETWGNWTQELRDSGFSELALLNIINCITETCGMNQENIDAATESFILGQEKEQNGPLSPSSALKDTLSGGAAKD